MNNSVSQFLESGLLNHIFRGVAYPRPSSICIALTSGVASRTDDGSTMGEIPQTINGSGTGYSRVNLGNPATSGSNYWDMMPSGDINNHAQWAFNTVLCDIGWVSGVAIMDSPVIGSGNILLFGQADNPRMYYMGDNPKLDPTTLDISLI